ncbi:hypothetical protein KP806_23610 [Paenibacillus sp. N4]|nr:hypothetical protein [Paenibacillus vietnamensis]MCA0758050.1 hypothetical protein [Paenibacillus vietnamensis]
MKKDFRLAELNGQPDALDAIRRLEEQLTEQYGSEVALVAYSEDKEEN